MEDAVNERKESRDFRKRDVPFTQNPQPFLGNMTTGICRTYRTVGMPRTQLDIECTAFAFLLQNALCVNVSLADIARRQFVPTNCACSPRQTIGEIRP